MITPLGRRTQVSWLHPAALATRSDQAMHDSFAIAPRIAHRIVLALPLLGALAGCAPAPGPEAARASVAPTVMEEQKPQICRPDSALLVPQRAPDCVFGRPDLKTLDPEQWARLKIEYERQCYQRAERTVRERLRQLQTAMKCENASLVR